MSLSYIEIKQQLINKSDEKLAKFNLKLCPDTKKKVLGVKIPELRKMAKQIAKNNFDEVIEDIKCQEPEYLEEATLQGLIIGYSKIDYKNKLNLIADFIHKIDSWAITDTVSSTLKAPKEDLKILWDWLIPYTKSKKEFEVRFAVIMILDNFIISEYVDDVIVLLDGIQNREYYAQMAIAWTLAEVGIKFNDKAMNFLKGKNNLDVFTYNKTLQKMIESYRISDEQKVELKNMKH